MNKVPLKRVARIIAGQSPKSEDVTPLTAGIPFLQGNAEFGPENPKPKFECNLASKYCDTGDILLSVRAPVGAVNIADRRYAVGRGVCAIRAESVDQRYLWWWLNGQSEILNSVATGSTYSAVTAEQVGAIEVPAMGLGEQRRIADFLDAEVGLVEAAGWKRREVSVLARQRHRALIDMEIVKLSEKFGDRLLRRSIVGMEQGFSPLCDNYPASEGEWGVLKVSSVKLGVFTEEENKHYPEGDASMSRYEVKEGDLLVTRANTPSLVGSVALVPRVREKLLISDKIFRVKTSGNIDPRFLAFAAGGSRIRGMCAMASHGTSQSMVNLKSEEIKAWPIPAAPLDEQARAAARFEESRVFTDRLRELADRQIQLLEERKRALITAAVTGQIDVTTARGADVS
ncbi:restriction endonuclease subunit S [Nocardiopsis sp. FR4]|uniref:restriction endonuclease subunit S n=1 Tax=Nocardiopsis sp. FR4 TaxID=2605985 RepID=UPI00135C28F3|nr:restriction endonuclease subunit S [Nocardiopsis sp. FR4]